MTISVQQLVRQIHDAQTRFVLAVAGGGISALDHLLEVPGASRSVLEAVVPYSPAAMAKWLGGKPDQSCSSPTARAMAMVAFFRARQYDETAAGLAGLACTAALATDRPRQGSHRAYLAAQTAEATVHWCLELAKGRRTRPEEERLVGSVLLNLVAETCGLEARLPLALGDAEHLEPCKFVAPDPWRKLLLGQSRLAQAIGPPQAGGATRRRAIFPGAFNPLHSGHRRMAQVAQALLGVPAEFEISILNVDKPPLDYWEINRRVAQFSSAEVVWLTRASTFCEKASLFPGAIFIVGADTLRRIADPRYYADEPAACSRAIELLAACDCRFLVFARAVGGCLLSLADLQLPNTLRSICEEVPASQFREDICSTHLRAAIGEQPE